MSYNSNSLRTNRIIKIILIALAAVLVLLLALFGFCKAVLGSDKIYDGISVSGHSLGGLTQLEATELLSKKFDVDGEKTLTLLCEDFEESFTLSEIEPALDATSTAAEAFSYARYGSIIERIKKVLDLKNNPLEIPVSVAFNDDVLYAYTDKLTLSAGTPMEELSAALDGDVLTVNPGKPGFEINRKTAKKLIVDSLVNNEYSVKLSLEEMLPAEPTAEEIHYRFYADPKDASFELVDNEIIYTEATTGIHFDKAAAKDAIAASDGGEIKLSVVVIEPDVTVGELKEKMFRDRLATYSSKYNEGVVGRSHNVKLASSFINGKIMMPGDVFSYNETVGPRTLARGFKEANVYVGNEVETGVGGGICQVSSTLFNSVVMSGLSIVSRTSHSLPVSYVPPGRDATVSYGSIDFKFSNPYDMPVKIVSSASGGVNTVTIYGTNNNPGRKVSFETELVKTIPYEVKKTEDSSLPEGTVKVETQGANGSSYNTYKVITENGAVISRTLLTKSTYNATPQTELIGTGPAEAEPVSETDVTITEKSVQTQNPESTETAVTQPAESEDPAAEATDTPSENEEPAEEDTPSIKPVSPSVG